MGAASPSGAVTWRRGAVTVASGAAASSFSRGAAAPAGNGGPGPGDAGGAPFIPRCLAKGPAELPVRAPQPPAFQPRLPRARLPPLETAARARGISVPACTWGWSLEAFQGCPGRACESTPAAVARRCAKGPG